jgi:hypothetical protein
MASAIIEGRNRKDGAHYSFPALGSAPAANGSRNPIKPGIKSADFDARPWHIVAGPPLTPNQLHCATVSDGPDCQWKGGDYERLEAKNRAALKKHFAELAKQCLIQPHRPPVNVLGGYRFPDAPNGAGPAQLLRGSCAQRSGRGRSQHPRLSQARAKTTIG